MPELPEVEVSRMGIAPHLEQQTICKIHRYFPTLRWPIPDDIFLAEGSVIRAVKRRAKYLLLQTELGDIVLHLGMSGKLCVVDKHTPRVKHDHLDIELSSGQVLRFHDPRRFGAVLWQAQGSEHSLLSKLGPEPLTEQFDAAYLYGRCQQRSVPIKTLLMDNHVVVGVGNIYANESLFKAGILPTRAADSVSKAQCQRLVPIIKATLAQAIAQGGTSLKDFAQADGKPGYFAQELLVYGRKGLPCVSCGRELSEIRLAQRSTVFCRHCQR